MSDFDFSKYSTQNASLSRDYIDQPVPFATYEPTLMIPWEITLALRIQSLPIIFVATSKCQDGKYG